MQQTISYANVVSDNIPLPVEDTQNALPPGWVKLTRGANGNKVRTKVACIPQTHHCIALLEHNIELSFEFEKNRYYHPFQRPYDNYTDSEPEEEDEEEETLE